MVMFSDRLSAKEWTESCIRCLLDSASPAADLLAVVRLWRTRRRRRTGFCVAASFFLTTEELLEEALRITTDWHQWWDDEENHGGHGCMCALLIIDLHAWHPYLNQIKTTHGKNLGHENTHQIFKPSKNLCSLHKFSNKEQEGASQKHNLHISNLEVQHNSWVNRYHLLTCHTPSSTSFSYRASN